MQKSNAEILNHFYSLLLEMNFHRPDEDVFPESDYQEDPFIQKHLRRIRLKSAQYKVIRNKSIFSSILAEIKRLKDLGVEEINKLLNPQEAVQMQILFRKFDDLSEKDQESIEEDEELMQLIIALKEKIDTTKDE